MISIQYVLTYPENFIAPGQDYRYTNKKLQFLNQIMIDFRLKVAYDVGRKGGSYPVVFNAANEAAVTFF